MQTKYYYIYGKGSFALKSFADIRSMIDGSEKRGRLGVIEAQDAHTLEAIADAVRDNLVIPTLIGREEEIVRIWTSITDLPVPRVVNTEDTAESLAAAMMAVNLGQLDCIMKGKLETATLMKAALNRDTGIRKNGSLSLVALMESPNYHKVFGITDVGLMTYPTLSQKEILINNAVEVFKKLGVECPKVGVIAAVENVNPKMPETVDAHELKEMNMRGEIKDCIVEGPISYDLCMNAEAARIKGYESPVTGDVDIIIVPDIVVGNVLAKSITTTGGGRTCGTVCGAKVPIILTSRSASADDKYMSIVLAALLGV